MPVPKRPVDDKDYELLATALAGVSTQLSANTQAQQDLKKKLGRTRRQAIILAISVLLDVLLSFGLAYSLHKTNESVHRNKKALIAVCESSNKTAQGEHQLWEGIITLTANNPSTQAPEEKARQQAQFRELLDVTFPTKDCSKVTFANSSTPRVVVVTAPTTTTTVPKAQAARANPTQSTAAKAPATTPNTTPATSPAPPPTSPPPPPTSPPTTAPCTVNFGGSCIRLP